MEKRQKGLELESFCKGDILSVADDGTVRLPVREKDKQMLFVETGRGYKLIPLRPDVRKIYIEPTTVCNFSCITCIRNSWEEEHVHMEWEVFCRIMESTADLPNLEGVFFGGFGEPMLHPRFFDMLQAVKAKGLRAEMITNGSLLSEENMSRLMDCGVDRLFVSFDSPEEEEYNRIRPGGDFRSVYESVRRLQAMKEEKKSAKPELGIEFVAMKSNFSRLPKLIRMAWEMNANQVIVSNFLPYHESMKDEIVYDMDDTGRMFGADSLLCSVRANMSQMRLRTERHCKFVDDKTLCVNSRGNVSPCYALMHQYTCYVYGREKKMYPCYIGNVREMSLRDIWLDKGYVNFRESLADFRFPSCTDCRSLDGCNYTEDNQTDCWGNGPSCAECLWARRIIACP